MQAWEYQWVLLEKGGPYAEKAMAVLNATWGAEGWEAVDVMDNITLPAEKGTLAGTRMAIRVLLKRPVGPRKARRHRKDPEGVQVIPMPPRALQTQ